MTTAPQNGADRLVAGYDALERAEWAVARERFEALVEEAPSAQAWEGLSRAAWWQGDQAATMAAREAAYRAYLEAGDVCGAARAAAWLGSDHIDFAGDDAIGLAWLRRARDVLGAHPPCREHGWIALLEIDGVLHADGDREQAAAQAGEVVDLARDLGDAGLEVVARALRGSALVAAGRTAEGLAELDRAGALAVGERFEEPLAPGWALCKTVFSCANLGDFQRAAQWCRVMHRYSATWSSRHFFGVCRAAYGGVLTTHGRWASAEEELSSALADLRAARPGLAAPAAVRLGELRVRQGRIEDARELFASAVPYRPAVAALGELALAAGDASGAVDAAERVLRRCGPGALLDRVPALELLARAHAAAGAHDAAGQALDDLERILAALGTPYMRARAALARAEVEDAAGRADAARRAAEDAVDLFAACSAPYEAARARLVLARTLTSLGRHERAAEERTTAQAALAALRAGARAAAADGAELSPREVEILRLVADGRSDAAIAERLFLSPHTVHRHVANIRVKLRVPSRSAAVAHATRAGLL